VDTVLIDQEMVYAPRLTNDWLLLGLKGSLNEYELDLLRQRSVEARREKAISRPRINAWKKIPTCRCNKPSFSSFVSSLSWARCDRH
jgi:hypothetical protein